VRCPAAASRAPQPLDVLDRARAFSEPLLGRQRLDTGENTLAMPTAWRHPAGIGAAPVDAGRGLPGVCRRLPAAQPEDVVAKAFGEATPAW
jgi:hypothetical protein